MAVMVVLPAAGQLEVLDSYGITEEFCGCPIRATMETSQIGFTSITTCRVYRHKYARRRTELL